LLYKRCRWSWRWREFAREWQASEKLAVSEPGVRFQGTVGKLKKKGISSETIQHERHSQKDILPIQSSHFSGVYGSAVLIVCVNAKFGKYGLKHPVRFGSNFVK
jgi:hypothetical protein